MYKEPYHFNVNRYYSNFQAVKDFASGQQTPVLLIDTQIIKDKYLDLIQSFPLAHIYYAVKANPMYEVLCLLNSLGSNFDVASRYELDQLLAMGVQPERISYGNTIKKRSDVSYFYEKGVRLFATDSENDLKNLASCAPDAKIFFR
ncbi:MAG: type III PLP-dependent enzyme, partial [Candidatus Cloacimonetes bacterium]|nr:type III PLP-dependent enzyme [Candidatus Cloacimonadota bacterium]